MEFKLTADEVYRAMDSYEKEEMVEYLTKDNYIQVNSLDDAQSKTQDDLRDLLMDIWKGRRYFTMDMVDNLRSDMESKKIIF